jgi:integration host factor subunit alpha
MSLTKAELIESLCAKTGLSRQDARDLLENFFTEITESLARGEEVKISGFGNFTLKDKRARPGRNPRTGKEVTITERRVVTFKQGQKLKGCISHSSSDAMQQGFTQESKPEDMQHGFAKEEPKRSLAHESKQELEQEEMTEI